MSIDRDLPPLQGDPAQLERAFVNVLENAARYSAGKPVSVRARAVGGRLRVRSSTRARGSRSTSASASSCPSTAARTPASGHHGSGLGLAIARGFVEVNGGRIAVESAPGQGTSFVVEFPLARGGAIRRRRGGEPPVAAPRR